MDYYSFDSGNIPAAVNISRFRGKSGVDEIHIAVRPTSYGSMSEQLRWVEEAYTAALASQHLDPGSSVLRRFFCSDLPNQAEDLLQRPFSNPRSSENPCAVSWIRQPPVPPVKVALLAYHIADPAAALQKVQEGTTLVLQRGDLTHSWTTGIICPEVNTSYEQTYGVFAEYLDFLNARGMTLAENVVRTWLFVQNVDANYSGLVKARRELFTEHGLTADTHYIASTGIEGAYADVRAKVTMDVYAIKGLKQDQIRYLEALDHLSPTHVYGVTFERATAVSYRDRRQVVVSGTASIDRDGNIVHPGNVQAQLERAIENIEALLKQGGAALSDIGLFIVYVRDPSDHEYAWRRMRERFGSVPMEVVVASVCRPGWLIEVEGKALVAADSPMLPAF